MARLNSASKKGWRRKVSDVFGYLFCKRSVIIISEHKTQHVPFTVGMQLFGLIAALVFVGWASYSSGSYVAAQKVLIEKDIKIANTTEQNEKVEAEFALLRRDLTKIAHEGSKGELGDYAKMVTEQYGDGAGKNVADGTESAELSDKYNAVFKRIEFLENKVKDLQHDHEAMIADIRQTTGGKISELESVISQTGMDKSTLEHAAEAKQNRDEQHREKYGRIDANAQGGPLEPVSDHSILKEKETDLYFNLKRMMVLNDIVSAMPLSVPMNNDYRRTSGFGTRVDPFRGRLAFHSGVDLAGPIGARIRATSDGKVVATGWHGAYGNMIDVQHEYGFTTRYGHLSQILVKEGQVVHKGDVIAIQGSTGRSTGNHLHYEVRYNNKPIDPANFLKAGEHVRAL